MDQKAGEPLLLDLQDRSEENDWGLSPEPRVAEQRAPLLSRMPH